MTRFPRGKVAECKYAIVSVCSEPSTVSYGLTLDHMDSRGGFARPVLQPQSPSGFPEATIDCMLNESAPFGCAQLYSARSITAPAEDGEMMPDQDRNSAL